MNEFYSLNEAWDWSCDYVLSQMNHVESRVGGSWEATDVSWKIKRGDSDNGVFLLDSRRNASPYYAMGELIWYLSGSNKIDHIKKYSAKYPYFSDDGVTAHGAYGNRILHNHGFTGPREFFENLASHLKSNKNDRRVFVSTWNPEADYLKKSNDIPCTVGWMIKLRGNRLHWHTIMRSNDLWLGMPYDVWCFSMIQSILAEACGVEVGDYTHTVGSLHIYERNEQDIQARKSARQFYEPEAPCDMTLDDVEQLVQIEEKIRLDGVPASDFSLVSQFAQDAIELVDEWLTKDFTKATLSCNSLRQARRMYLNAK